MPEVDLLKNYPRAKRKLKQRAQIKTAQVIKIARKFGKEYFDGDRKYGYGGFDYNQKFWQMVIPDFQKQYGLTKSSRILDVGCAKGFMLFDFQRLIPGIEVSGIDISKYAITNALAEIKNSLNIADARSLPFEDKSFDLVISINTIHNLNAVNCKKALKEIMRVSKKHAFITVDAYRNDMEKQRMQDWNLTALTYMHVDAWRIFFRNAGYTGDYFWFIP